jgi:hypothetical protein
MMMLIVLQWRITVGAIDDDDIHRETMLVQ